jgi:hypothetical protein
MIGRLTFVLLQTDDPVKQTHKRSWMGIILQPVTRIDQDETLFGNKQQAVNNPHALAEHPAGIVQRDGAEGEKAIGTHCAAVEMVEAGHLATPDSGYEPGIKISP